MRPRRAIWGALAAASAVALAAASPGPAGASEYSKSLARKVDREIVYVDPKAKPRVPVGDAGQIRLRILQKDAGRIKIAVVPEGRAEDEGGAAGLGEAIGRDLELRGTLLVVAGRSAFVLTSYQDHPAAVAAVEEAFKRHEGDRTKQLLAAVSGIAAVDPGPSADPSGGAPGAGDFNDQTDGIFDSVNDAIRTTTIVIAAFFIVPILALLIWIFLRVRRGRRDAEGDLDFEQEGLRNELIALGDDIRALEVDTSMPGVNAMGVADYEAAVQQYDRANFALERSEQNPRYVAEARAAIAEGKRRMSDAKVRLGVTPTP